MRRVLDIHWLCARRDQTDQTFIGHQACGLHRFRLQAFCRDQFELAGFKPQVNRANVSNERAGNKLDNTAETPIQAKAISHQRPEPRHEDARCYGTNGSVRPVDPGHDFPAAILLAGVESIRCVQCANCELCVRRVDQH